MWSVLRFVVVVFSMRRAAQFCMRRRFWTEEADRPERRGTSYSDQCNAENKDTNYFVANSGGKRHDAPVSVQHVAIVQSISGHSMSLIYAPGDVTCVS